MSKFFLAKMEAVGKLVIIFAVLILLWIMSATISPIKPHRLGKYPICNITPPSHIEFVYQHPATAFEQPEFVNFCKYNISQMTLYKALTLNVTYKLNQPASFEVSLHRAGWGPMFVPVKINPNDTNKLITSTWLLNEADLPKLNWLSGSYEQVIFRVSQFDPNKELILSIYEVYLL